LIRYKSIVGKEEIGAGLPQYLGPCSRLESDTADPGCTSCDYTVPAILKNETLLGLDIKSSGRLKKDSRIGLTLRHLAPGYFQGKAPPQTDSFEQTFYCIKITITCGDYLLESGGINLIYKVLNSLYIRDLAGFLYKFFVQFTFSDGTLLHKRGRDLDSSIRKDAREDYTGAGTRVLLDLLLKSEVVNPVSGKDLGVGTMMKRLGNRDRPVHVKDDCFKSFHFLKLYLEVALSPKLFYNKREVKQKKTILILGAGFCGIAAALELDKNIDHESYRIVVVNKRNVHIFRPNLYELATAFNERITKACLLELRESVAIPLHQIFKGTKVKCLIDTILAIDPKTKTVTLTKNEPITGEILIMAMGSAVNYYGITGLKANSLTMKSLSDSLKISCDLDNLLLKLWESKTVRDVELVIGGGGATGVELACELPGYINKLCCKYNYPRDRVHITVVEGSDRLISQGGKVVELVKESFKKYTIRLMLRTRITKATATTISLRHPDGTEELLRHDLLIWTGGVRAHPVIENSFEQRAPNGSLPVSQFLELQNLPDIYAGGDSAQIINQTTGAPLPWLAQLAQAHGSYIARRILAKIEGKTTKPYKPKFKGVLVPLGGSEAIYMKDETVIKGRLIHTLRSLVDLLYSLHILPIIPALHRWWRAQRVFSRND